MPRPRTHDDALRVRLLEAASAALAAGGPAALSLRSVATAAGTTTAAVYTLFGGREALVEAVVEEGFRRFAAYLDAAPRSDDPWADLLALGVAYRANAVENPHFYRVMFAPAGGRAGAGARDDPRRGVAAPTFAVLRDAVVRATAAEGGEADAVAVRLWALAHGLVSLELAGLLPGSPEERARAYVAALRGEPRLGPRA
ncbi:WHG domain-containing protein [Georgenia sp. TF02-10]|uniref:TetR-like C-terminal domain-containing protein n=1 Tax=Georgenia sp. TF02-10 TaxID=2917725 RepID=UPI001FA6B158|nr:TetR-like C-terminal domain-containing protein [Georgenia sp. TF02-10]UNX55929.1 WHG domain-containing protein [Georgenia sp. TF02-10]